MITGRIVKTLKKYHSKNKSIKYGRLVFEVRKEVTKYFILSDNIFKKRGNAFQSTIRNEPFKIGKMDALFSFDHWQMMFEEFKHYSKYYQDKETGDKMTLRSYSPRLSNWVKVQRQNYKKGILSKEKINALESLKNWHFKFNKSRRYR